MKRNRDDHTRRIPWLITIRWVMVFLTFLIIVFSSFIGQRLTYEPFVIIFALWVLNVIYYIITPYIKNLHHFAFVQIVIDAVLISLLVYYTHGIDGQFTFLYFAPVLAASLVFSQRASVFFALLETVFLFAITIEQSRYYPDWVVEYLERLPWLLAQGAALHLVAFFSGVLSIRLREARFLNDQILQSMSEGVLSIDADGTLMYMNNAARNLLGLKLEEKYIGRKLSDILEAGLDSALKMVLLARREGTVEVKLATEYGRPRQAELTTSNLVDEKGRPQGVVMILVDITERKKMERSLMQVEKLQAVGEMAAAIAHEIRNPLSCIRGSAQELQERLGSMESEKKLLAIVVRESDRLDRTITDFLRYARLPKIKPRRCELKKLLNEVITILRENPSVGSKDLTVELSGDGDLCCRGDAEQLKQAFLNLLRNAADAMEGRGHLKIVVSEVKAEDAGTLLKAVSGSPEDKFVKIDFIDNGPGIPKDTLGKIFDPFFTTKATGTGLGLSIVRRVVEAHEGRVFAKSVEGGGTRFSVFFKSVL